MHLRLFFSRTVPLLLLTLPIAARGKELEGVYTPAQNPCPAPDDAIKKMKVPEGYEVRNFAAEPLVVNPVAMTWDHRGRLWVVELFEYPRGAAKPNEYSKTATDEKFRPVLKGGGPDWPRDKVIILEDTDNDGKADKRTVFVDGLNLTTGILCGYGGVFVGQAPNLFFFRDNDGNDTADEYKTVLTGFGLEDRHELLNSFTWGPDGWLYMTHGVFTHSKVRRPDQKPEEGFKLDAGVFRVRITANRPDRSNPSDPTAPHAATYEVFADGTSNPWGVDFDARGNAFVSACVIDHLFHMAPGGLYQRQGGQPENPYAYELLPSIVSHKHFRAAYAGVQIYQGGIYPPDTHGHVFIGNIHDNAIHEESLTPVGATFKAAPVRDFLRANDGWFRPVSTQTGPDGFLWVMDWCDKYPCYQNAQANPEGVDRERGRIWRVCYTTSEEGKFRAGKSRPADNVDYVKFSDETLAHAAISAPNNWSRRMASRVLLERKGGTGGPASDAETASKSSDPGKRRQAALSACEMRSDANPPSWLVNLAADPDPSVRHAIAVAARRLGLGGGLTVSRKALAAGSIQPILTQLVTSSPDADSTLAFAIWMALEPEVAANPQHYLPWLAEVGPKSKPLSNVLIYKTARRIAETQSPENMDLLLAFLDKIKSNDVLTARALDGLLKGQEARVVKPAKVDPAGLFAHWATMKADYIRNHAGRLATLWGDKTAVAELIRAAEDPKTEPARRAEAIKTLRKLDSEEARAALLRILEQSLPK